MKRMVRIALSVCLLLATFVYANNANSLAPAMSGKPLLLAHRGMAQPFSHEGLTNDTCTATRIFPPAHDYLENTLASIEAAFSAGADIVEFDIHPTTDGLFAVIHDWTVGCRTEGKGITREQTLSHLKTLDIGYGYTADGGKTFPFRGKGVGLMPSLDEVLAALPNKRFLINIKSDDPDEGEKLADRLAQLPPSERELLMVYGGRRAIAALRVRLPDVRAMSGATIKRCGLIYLSVGWTGYVPNACRHTLLLLPINYAGYLWGWPNRFIQRMRGAGTPVFVIGARDANDVGSRGIDDEAALQALPGHFDGGIWTNRIDIIGPLVQDTVN